MQGIPAQGEKLAGLLQEELLEQPPLGAYKTKPTVNIQTVM